MTFLSRFLILNTVILPLFLSSASFISTFLVPQKLYEHPHTFLFFIRQIIPDRAVIDG